MCATAATAGHDRKLCACMSNAFVRILQERLSGDEKNDQKLYAIVKTLNEMLIKKSTRRDRQSVSLKPRRHFTSYI